MSSGCPEVTVCAGQLTIDDEIRRRVAAADETAVPMSEMQAIWDGCAQHGILFNGMTDELLRARYGDRLRHIAGVGWFARDRAGAAS